MCRGSSSQVILQAQQHLRTQLLPEHQLLEGPAPAKALELAQRMLTGQVDYILFARADVSLAPNPDEVQAVRYVDTATLRAMMAPESGLRWSPWFRRAPGARLLGLRLRSARTRHQHTVVTHHAPRAFSCIACAAVTAAYAEPRPRTQDHCHALPGPLVGRLGSHAGH